MHPRFNTHTRWTVIFNDGSHRQFITLPCTLEHAYSQALATFKNVKSVC